MDERKEYHAPEEGSYQTGSTQPPKKRQGLIALLLVGIIVLGGLVCALGFSNWKLYGKLQEKNPFQVFSTQPSTSSTVPDPVIPTDNDVELDLQPIPTEVPDVPGESSAALTYVEIYEKAIPSVVSITCTTQSGRTYGTGVVLAENGYIVTNNHVIENAQAVSVQLTDGRVLDGQLVGADEMSDLAVLYVPVGDLTPAEFGDSSMLRVGEDVAAIGDPLGPEFRGTMTAGIVSAINRDVSVNGRTMTLIQTNAALNSGNSGGPLLNAYGQVVGINTMKISTFVDTAGVEGLGFAIPSTTVKEIVDQLIGQGYVSGRPILHIQGQAVSMLDQKYYGLPAGFQVSQVQEGSAAAQAGLLAGDIIMTFNSAPVESPQDLQNALYSCRVGQTVQMQVYRHRTGSTVTLQITLQEESQ